MSMFEIPELLQLDNLKTKRYKDDDHLNQNSTWRQFYHDEYVKRDKEIDWTKDDETERERINSFVLTTLLNLHGKLLEEQIKRPATPPNQPKNITKANEKKNNPTPTPVKKRTNRELDENKGKNPTERINTTTTTKKKASNKVPELTSENTGLEAIDEIIERNAQAWNKAYGKKPDETIADFSMFLVYLHPKTISRKTLDSLHDDLKVAYEEFMDNFQLELWIESFEKDPEDTQEKFEAALTILGEQGIKPVVLSGLPEELKAIYKNRFQKNNATPTTTPQNGSKQADQMSIESTKPLQLTPSDGNNLDLEKTSYGKETNESKKSEQTTVETPSSNQTLSKKINPFAVRYVKRYNEDREEALVWFENKLRTGWLPRNLVLARDIVPDLPKEMQEIHKKHAKEVDKRKRIQEEERERKQRERALPLYKKQADVWENKYKQHPEDTKREFLDFLKSPESAKISTNFIRELPDGLQEVYEDYIKSENDNEEEEEEEESTTPRSPKRRKTSQNGPSSSSLSSGQQISHQLEVISVDGDSSGQQIRHQESIKTQKPPVIPVISVDDEMEIDNKIPVRTPPPLSSPVPVSSGSFVHRNSTLPLGLSFEEIQTRLAGYTSNPRNERDAILFEIYNRAPFLFVLDLGPMRDQRGNWQRYPEKKYFDENTEFRLWVDNMIKIYDLGELKSHFQDSLSKSISFDKVNRPLRLPSENIYQNLITYNMYFGIGRFPDFKAFKYESNVYVYIYRRTTLRRQLGDVHALNPIQTQKFFLVKFSSTTTTFGVFDQTKMTYDMEFRIPTDPENNFIKVIIEFIKLRHHDGETYYYLNKKKETAVFRSQQLGNVSLEVLYMNPMTKRKQSKIIIKPK